MDNCALGYNLRLLMTYLQKITKISIMFVKKGRKVFNDPRTIFHNSSDIQ